MQILKIISQFICWAVIIVGPVVIFMTGRSMWKQNRRMLIEEEKQRPVIDSIPPEVHFDKRG